MVMRPGMRALMTANSYPPPLIIFPLSFSFPFRKVEGNGPDHAQLRHQFAP